MEVNMMKRNVMFVIAFGLATLASHTPLSAEQADQALLKAMPWVTVKLAMKNG